ncbi:MAG: DUF488 domain-containing protein [Acidimicrobiales bacterium]
MVNRKIEIVRVYEDPGRKRGEHRVLVDRLWPRGLSKAAVDYDDWSKDVAPSSELRRWYGHEPERFSEFSRRYRRELKAPPAAPALAHLLELAGHRLILLTATRDVEHSGAAVLRAVLEHEGR